MTAILKGYVRQWVRCNECGHAAYYDYIPYSLSNPIMTMPCGHGLTQRIHEIMTRITAAEAAIIRAKEYESI
jgi:hypothetical protein